MPVRSVFLGTPFGLQVSLGWRAWAAVWGRFGYAIAGVQAGEVPGSGPLGMGLVGGAGGRRWGVRH